MGTGATPQSARSTSEQRVARLFGLQGDSWMRHANPWSVWTRFAVLPLLAVSIWSRDWIGWWCLIPVALSLVFMVVNPLLFPEPRSTRNWTSRAVFGERLWADRNRVRCRSSSGPRRSRPWPRASRWSAWPCWCTAG
jgi:hypothetical protein